MGTRAIPLHLIRHGLSTVSIPLCALCSLNSAKSSTMCVTSPLQLLDTQQRVLLLCCPLLLLFLQVFAISLLAHLAASAWWWNPQRWECAPGASRRRRSPWWPPALSCAEERKQGVNKNVNQLRIQALRREGSDLAQQAASAHWKVTLASVNSSSESSCTGADQESKMKFPQPRISKAPSSLSMPFSFLARIPSLLSTFQGTHDCQLLQAYSIFHWVAHHTFWM